MAAATGAAAPASQAGAGWAAREGFSLCPAAETAEPSVGRSLPSGCSAANWRRKTSMPSSASRISTSEGTTRWVAITGSHQKRATSRSATSP